jgi:hypothetical protein
LKAKAGAAARLNVPIERIAIEAMKERLELKLAIREFPW